MGKHSELLKHRDIKKISISESGGMIITFEDESHTYIDSYNIRVWITELNKLVEKGKIIYEEE